MKNEVVRAPGTIRVDPEVNDLDQKEPRGRSFDVDMRVLISRLKRL